MATTIEQLELEIHSNSTSAVSGIDSLSTSLSKLKNALQGGLGLTAATNQLKNLNNTIKEMDAGSFEKLSKLAEGLEKLKNVGSFRISPTIGRQLSNIGTAIASLSGIDFTGIERFSSALEPLRHTGRITGLTSTINALGRLPLVAQSLHNMDISEFSSRIRELTDILSPLATRLNLISTAFNRLPNNMRRITDNTNQLVQVNNRVHRSYIDLWAGLNLAKDIFIKVGHSIASFIDKSNQYIEDINLFHASMGKYASEAKKYAEQVGEILGIDPGEFMRNQGVFNTIITGFGVANEQANLMSKNLTQLGYDIASFYNISFENAMQKLQSGISGELEPLRRLGYDLSVARLQEEALALGIKKKVSQMTQAEKSQLRYYAIMTQVTTAQGDMARTMNAPANQIRIFNAQIAQCARALGNIFIPALNAILPYAIAIVKVIRLIADSLASVMGFKLPEVDYSDVTKGLKDTSGGMDKYKDSTDKATKATKKLKNAMLGIDELNILSKEDDALKDLENNAGKSNDLGIKLPEYDFLKNAVSSKVDDIVKILTSALSQIEAAISVFLLVFGTILIVSGVNIPLGIALIAVGAAGLVHSVVTNWNAMSEPLARTLTFLLGLLGGFFFVLGVILVLTGNVPLGIALMVIGAAAIVTALAINWTKLKGDLENVLVILAAVVGGALLILGVVLLCAGFIPLGIAAIVAGITMLVAAATINWGSGISQQIKTILSALVAIVGGALLALGVILLFAGNIPIGIALIAAGAIALVTAVALNWGAIKNSVGGVFNAILAIVSGALLGIGAILIACGVSLPLGVGLMVAGAAGLAATVTMNWGAITGQVTKFFKEFGTTIGGYLLGIGILLVMAGILPLGIGLIVVGAASLAAGVALNWGAVKAGINKFFKDLGIIIGASLVAIGVLLCCVGIIPLGVGLIVAGLGMAAYGAALNWGTMPTMVGNTLNKTSGHFKKFSKNVNTELGSSENRVQSWFTNVNGRFSKGVDTKKSTAQFKTFGNDMGSNLKNGITNGFGDPKSLFENRIFNPFNDAIRKSKPNPLEVGLKSNIPEQWSQTKSWWDKETNNGLSVDAKVGLKKDGWNDVKSWVGTPLPIDQHIGLRKQGWNNVHDWVGKPQVLNQNVELRKQGWHSVRDWVGDVPTLSQNLSLRKQGWTTVKNWVGDIPTVDQNVGLRKNGWTTVKNWVGDVPNIDQNIELKKQGWNTVRSWIGDVPNIDQHVGLRKIGWDTVRGWVGDIPTVNQNVELRRQGWNSVRGWIGDVPSVDQNVELRKYNWNTVRNWVGDVPSLDQGIGLKKNGWNTVRGWVGDVPDVEQRVALRKNGWDNLHNFVKGNTPDTVDVRVNLISQWKGKIKEFFGLASGGIVTAGGGIQMLASGGVITPNMWKSIPKYANGTNNIHGSMFIAGEAGAELVGHVNGTTEVLNRFQLAQVMHHSIVSGMTQFAGFWQDISRDIITCTNGIINAIAVCTSQINENILANNHMGYDTHNTLSRDMYEESKQAYISSNNDDTLMKNIRDFYHEYVEPTLREIAADTKRQADKDEKTVVQVGNRVVNDAITTQRRANGYSFTG